MRFQVHLTFYPQVIISSINDWEKERQFQALIDQKDERSVKLNRDGIEKMVNIKVFLLFAILEPGEVVARDVSLSQVTTSNVTILGF